MKTSDFKKQVWQGEPWDESIDHLKDRPSSTVRQNIFTMAKNAMPVKNRSRRKLIWANVLSLCGALSIVFLLMIYQTETKYGEGMVDYVDNNPEVCAQVISEFEVLNLEASEISQELNQAKSELSIMNVNIEYYCSNLEI